MLGFGDLSPSRKKKHTRAPRKGTDPRFGYLCTTQQNLSGSVALTMVFVGVPCRELLGVAHTAGRPLKSSPVSRGLHKKHASRLFFLFFPPLTNILSRAERGGIERRVEERQHRGDPSGPDTRGPSLRNLFRRQRWPGNESTIFTVPLVIFRARRPARKKKISTRSSEFWAGWP